MHHVLVGQSVKFDHVALAARGLRTGEGETNDTNEVRDRANISLQTYSQQIDATIHSEENLVVRAIAEVVGRAEFVHEGIQHRCSSFHALILRK